MTEKAEVEIRSEERATTLALVNQILLKIGSSHFFVTRAHGIAAVPYREQEVK